MINILLVLFVLLFFSADVQAEGSVTTSPPLAGGGLQSAARNGEAGTEGNVTAPDRPDGNTGASEPATWAGGASSVQDDVVYQFDPVNVLAEKHQAGKASIGGKELQSLPSHTGTITEAIKGFSSVQFSNEDISSLTGGEIRPPRVSIAGAKPYENNFLIDGMSVSNTLNPSGLDQNTDSPNWNNLVVHGADQTIFYDSGLVDSVTVYTSNVPVKYGNFLGGLVAAELVEPRTDRWHGVVNGRHTRSQWFDLRGVDDESETSDDQARFSVYDLFMSVDGPVSENVALLFAVSRSWSEIPLRFAEDDGTFSDKSQWRYNNNYFAKALMTPSSDLKLTLDATYAPYSEKRWKSDWEDSGWTIDNKAYRLGSMLEWASSAGVLTARTAFSQNGFSRDSDTNVWKSDTTAPETIQEGGVGDARTASREMDAKLDFELAEFATRDILWRISTGLDIKNVTTNMWNEEARSIGTSAKYFSVTDYLEYDQTSTLNTLGWYVQPEFEWGRFTLTPGLRVDHDDYSFNTNVAPRLKAELDIMGDGALRLVGGMSRYYGGELRAYAFDRYRPFISNRVKRSNGAIMPTSYGTDRNYETKGLRTPYSDETMGGILGEILGFEYGIELVHREHKDQLISKTLGDDLYKMTNDGKSTYDGITILLNKAVETERFGNHFFSAGATKSRTKTFNGAYDSNANVAASVNVGSETYDFDYDKIYYDGAIMDRSEMPAEDYNAPLVLTFSWLGSFYDDHFRVNSVSRWRDSTTGLLRDERKAADTPYGTTASKAHWVSSQWLSPDQLYYYDAYKKGVISGGLVTDISLELDAVKKDLFTFTLLFDATNVFGSNGHSGVVQSDGFQDRMRGRGYYAGFRCEF